MGHKYHVTITWRTAETGPLDVVLETEHAVVVLIEASLELAACIRVEVV